jgi:hypothetical protein
MDSLFFAIAIGRIPPVCGGGIPVKPVEPLPENLVDMSMKPNYL